MGGRRLTARRQHERPSKQNNAAPTYTSQSCERSHGRKAVEAPGGRSFPERREVGILVRFCGCIKERGLCRLVACRASQGESSRLITQVLVRHPRRRGSPDFSTPQPAASCSKRPTQGFGRGMVLNAEMELEAHGLSVSALVWLYGP